MTDAERAAAYAQKFNAAKAAKEANFKKRSMKNIK